MSKDRLMCPRCLRSYWRGNDPGHAQSCGICRVPLVLANAIVNDPRIASLPGLPRRDSDPRYQPPEPATRRFPF